MNKLKEMFAESKWNSFSTEVFVDTLKTNRDLVNKLPVEISITRHSHAYVLIRDQTPVDNAIPPGGQPRL